MNIPIKNLQCFLTLVETRSYTRAAEQLHLTQPTLSKMIQRLEDNLEQPLLIRNNQKVQLTEAGNLLANSSRKIVGQWHRLQEDLNNLKGLKTGQLRLGVCPMMGGIIISLLSEFRRRYPGIELQIQELGGFGAEEALLNDSLDLAFTALPTTHAEEFHCQPLEEYPLQVCLPIKHPLAGKESITWSDLSGLPFVLYNDDFSLAKLLTRLSREDGVELNIASQSGQWDFIGAMVESNVGVAILPQPICDKIGSTKLVYKPMSPMLTWDLALIWRKNLPLTPAAEAFVRLGEG
ncbi:LysR family transcriptional regulator [Shewanella canadensis]|uniref:LysR family transcriptional regulator n=1 Tax=Shewanella canadensis TaxID=271096 RepID=A0A3S0IQT8_9GAMM|nr:LysR family transcriptional regulator [Shewanella canadensis]RTR40792.1 LysR family transcriptional regulator [Shewanella canadensis]